MNYFECCHYCVAPKRYPGCSGKCPDYKQARAKYDADRNKIRADRKVQSYTNTLICVKRNNHAKYLKGNRRFTHL